MKYIEFGEDKKKVSKIVIGTMRTAGLSTAETVALIDAGLEAGINFLDTADIYAGGKSEEILGTVFKENSALREKVFLQSKCGIRIDKDFTWFDFSKDYILQAVDASLQRLQTDYLDCLLLHRPDALMQPEEIAEAFTKLHDAGKVKNFGVSNFNPMMMVRLKEVLDFPIVANQVQLSIAHTPMIDAGFQVNMHWDGAFMKDGGILEYCAMNDIVIQSWSSLQYGYFEGVFLGAEKYQKLNEVIDKIAEKYNVTNTAVALAWILKYPAKMQAVIGTTKISRIKDAAKATDFELTKKDWYELYLAAGNKLP